MARRILLKISGEMLAGADKYGINSEALKRTAEILIGIKEEGFELGIVMGGGNVLRGMNFSESGFERTPADQMGMLATLINCVGLKTAIGAEAALFSAIECPKVAETFQYNRVLEELERGKIVIFAGGTGNPYFTTDTAAALRASEIKADYLLKATNVDFVYDKDPKDPSAKSFKTLSYGEYLNKKLGVMDLTAVTLCMNNQIPIFVFNKAHLGRKGIETLISEQQGTIIKG